MTLKEAAEWEQRNGRISLQTLNAIDQRYSEAIRRVTNALVRLKVRKEVFDINQYPLIQKIISDTVATLNDDIRKTLVNGIASSWALGNKKSDTVLTDFIGRKKLPGPVKKRLFDTNRPALQAFIARKENGMDLSGRVWKLTRRFKNELEQSVGLGIAKGQDARSMARQIKSYLNNPNDFFKDLRTYKDQVKVSRAALDYKPGQGVYKSSMANAFRLARTETNMAYRQADNERWKNFDFVTGKRIKTANNNPCPICSKLQGDYPKDFVWKGWHPACRCHQVPILISPEENEKALDAILAGEKYVPPRQEVVRGLPASFENYVKENKDRIEGWKSQPYWVQNNTATVLPLWNKDPVPAIMEKARQSAPEVQAIGKAVADKHGGIVSPVNFKSEYSMRRKITDEFGGDATQLKDPVRNTVVVAYKDLDSVVADLRKDPRFIKVKVQEGADYFGYKGVITNLQTQNGLIAEMQVNTPGMIYAKVSKNTALKLIDEKTYDMIAKKTGLPGGLGHKYYEKIRVLSAKERKLSITPTELKELNRLKKESADYYSKFYGF